MKRNHTARLFGAEAVPSPPPSKFTHPVVSSRGNCDEKDKSLKAAFLCVSEGVVTPRQCVSPPNLLARSGQMESLWDKQTETTALRLPIQFVVAVHVILDLSWRRWAASQGEYLESRLLDQQGCRPAFSAGMPMSGPLGRAKTT